VRLLVEAGAVVDVSQLVQRCGALAFNRMLQKQVFYAPEEHLMATIKAARSSGSTQFAQLLVEVAAMASLVDVVDM
jgi:hypothetical protein